MKNSLIATGTVCTLAVNGDPLARLEFDFSGPVGDVHSSMTRKLSGHDGAYFATSELKRGSKVYNTRSWTLLGYEEIQEVERTLGLPIPPGCLLENMVISGYSDVSHLAPGSRLVFPKRDEDGSQLILAVWEENSPCDGVGKRLQALYPKEERLSSRFIAAAQHKRGIMGFVYSPGFVEIDDLVVIYPPAE